MSRASPFRMERISGLWSASRPSVNAASYAAFSSFVSEQRHMSPVRPAFVSCVKWCSQIRDAAVVLLLPFMCEAMSRPAGPPPMSSDSSSESTITRSRRRGVGLTGDATTHGSSVSELTLESESSTSITNGASSSLSESVDKLAESSTSESLPAVTSFFRENDKRFDANGVLS